MSKLTEVKYLVVHASATKPSMNIGVKEIDEWHKQRGWKGIGYHFVIRRSGLLEVGRNIHEVGAHVYGYNKISLGICMVGGLDGKTGKPKNNFTRRQFETLHTLLLTLKQFYPEAEIVGHRDLSPDINGDGVIEKWEWVKECPCFDVQDWWSYYQYRKSHGM